MKRRVVTTVLALALLAPVSAVVTPSAHASVFTVTTLGDTTPDGSCSELHCTLREAVIAANSTPGVADEIDIPRGIVTLSLPGEEDAADTGDLDITSQITIRGVGRDRTFVDQTIVNEGVFDIVGASGHLILIDLSVRGGTRPGFTFGGGVRVNDVGGEVNVLRARFSQNTAGAIGSRGTATVEESIFEDNTAPQGAAILADGTTIITSTTFRNNDAEFSGGAIMNAGGTMTIREGSAITGNTAADGVGAAVVNTSDGSMTIDESTISDNIGAGIESTGTDTDLTIDASTISGNTHAAQGGGLYLSSADPNLIRNSTISGNSSDEGGGGALLAIQSGGSLAIQHTTITDNTSNADGDLTDTFDRGGGIFTIATQPAATIVASVIVDNTDIGSPPSPNSQNNCAGSQLVSLGDNVFGEIGDDNECASLLASDVSGVSNDGWLLPLADNGWLTETHAITVDAPAFDLQTSGGTGCPGTDQRGVDRPKGPGCDAGSYELAGVPDAKIAKSGAALIGNDIYNTDGTGQSVTQGMRAGRTAFFDLAFENDGASNDTFVIDGCSSSKGFVVKYFDGLTDVTNEVSNGVAPYPVAVGATKTLELQITVKRNAGNKIACDIRALSQEDEATADVVLAVVKRKR